MLRKTTAAIISVILAVWTHYLLLPAWNLRSPGFWWWALLVAVMTAIVFFFAEVFAGEEEMLPAGVSGCVAIVLVVFFAIGGITSSHGFFFEINSTAYHNIVEIETIEEPLTDVLPSAEEAPVVDWHIAQTLGSRVLGTLDSTIASWYQVNDEFNLGFYQGKTLRISPLEYGSIFKYCKAKSVPGYIVVDVFTQEPSYIELEKPMQYVPSAHFGKRLKRHLRQQYPTKMFTKSFFELDEEGNPFYITGIKEPSIGLFGGQLVESFILTDAVTGESKVYSVGELPGWIEHAYEIEYLMGKVNDVQRYINGFWNFSKTGVLKTTYQYRGWEYDSNGHRTVYFDGYNTVVDKNGELWIYSGVTPANNAESNLGFILASPRTGKIKFYACPGVEEGSAQSAAEGLVQHLGYQATFPNMVNVGEEPTYKMQLKDKSGVARLVSLANVSDYTKVVTAESLEEAEKLYLNMIGGKEVEAPAGSGTLESVIGTIEKLYQVTIDGDTTFVFGLEGAPEIWYQSKLKNNLDQLEFEVGTRVSLRYPITEDPSEVRIVSEIFEYDAS